ncbi:MAG: OadG family protein [Spirochaetaceae bacterium]|nr:OadG family protein [Spirochaetaceae bacterium]
MLIQGLTLTVVGMTVVFSFLTILVFVMLLMSAILPKYFPDAVKESKTKIKRSVKNEQNSIESSAETFSMGEAEIAAVIAAVKSYSHS